MSVLVVIPEGNLRFARTRHDAVISTKGAAVVERPLYLARSATNA